MLQFAHTNRVWRRVEEVSRQLGGNSSGRVADEDG